MLKVCRVLLGLALLLGLIGDSLARSHHKSQPQIKTSPFSEQQRPTQPPPPANFLTSQQIMQSIADGIDAAAKQYEARHPPTPPDYSSWWFNFLLVVFTGGLVIVGAGQGFLTFATLKTTQIAAEAAKRAAELAEKHERAYLVPGVSSLSWNDELKVAVFSMSVSNDGRTMGLLKKLYWQFSEIEPTGTPSYDEGDSRSFDVSFPGNTPAKTLPLVFNTITDRPQYFFGYVEYVDIFKRPHKTRFCLYIVPRMPKYDIAGPPAWSDWD
jgi:hypothetical protein